MLRDCVTSLTMDITQVAINVIEKDFGSSSTLEDLYNTFAIVPPKEVFYAYNPEEHGSLKYYKINDNIKSGVKLKVNKTALVVVGAFENHPNNGWMERVNENRVNNLVPVLEFAREQGLIIIHVPNAYGIAEDCKPRWNELVVHDEKEFLEVIDLHKIRNLVYVGYPANEDILYGPAGIIRLYMRKRYLKKSVPTYYIIEDSTLAFETPETFLEEKIKEVALDYRDILILSSLELKNAIVF